MMIKNCTILFATSLIISINQITHKINSKIIQILIVLAQAVKETIMDIMKLMLIMVMTSVMKKYSHLYKNKLSKDNNKTGYNSYTRHQC